MSSMSTFCTILLGEYVSFTVEGTIIQGRVVLVYEANLTSTDQRFRLAVAPNDGGEIMVGISLDSVRLTKTRRGGISG
jgi:hypothetical protein